VLARVLAETAQLSDAEKDAVFKRTCELCGLSDAVELIADQRVPKSGAWKVKP
jgi:hypothetical protein